MVKKLELRMRWIKDEIIVDRGKEEEESCVEVRVRVTLPLEFLNLLSEGFMKVLLV